MYMCAWYVVCVVVGWVVYRMPGQEQRDVVDLSQQDPANNLVSE